MKRYAAILAIPALLLAAACAPVQPPRPDPVKEELAILQKQLLELQKLQNDTKAKLDESTATIDALSAKVSALETRQAASPVVYAPAADPAPVITAQAKNAPAVNKKKPAKKPVKKKKKKVRRQE